jgi:hypothetical protein
MLYRIELFDVVDPQVSGTNPNWPAATFVAEESRAFRVVEEVRRLAARSGGSLTGLAGALISSRSAQGDAQFTLCTGIKAKRRLRVFAMPGALRVPDAEVA